MTTEEEDILIEQVREWINETVYSDSGRLRPIFFDEESDRLFFHASPLDFDKDDTPVEKYFLDERDNWREEYEPIIEKYFLG